MSQDAAVKHAFNHQLSVIEGPPGTGKTQTILNIVANAVMKGQNLAIVSNSNSATINVYEKLKKNGVSFIAAVLGNGANIDQFIESQSALPNLSGFLLDADVYAKNANKVNTLYDAIIKSLQSKNELA